MPLPLLALALGLGVGEFQDRRQAAGRRTGAQNLLAAGGLGGPQAGIDPTRVQALQQGLASDDPFTRRAALAEMQDYQAGLGLDMTPEQQQIMAQREQAMAAQQQSMDIRGAEEARRAQLFPGQLEAQGLGIENIEQQMAQRAQQMTYAAENQAAQMAALTAEAVDESILSLPDVVPMVNPLTGRPDNIAIAGEDYQKAQSSADAYQRSIAAIEDMVSLIDEYGSEWGGDVGVRMNNLRQRVLFEAVQARGGGAPQEAELELAAAGLPNPTSWQANLRGVTQQLVPGAGEVLRQAQESKFIAGYDQLRLDTSRALLDMLKLNPTLRVDVDALDPRVWVNDAEKEYYRANTGNNLLSQ